jgi:hypothetical protein
MSSAGRCKRLRERRRDGRAILQIEIDLFAHTELLISAGVLQQWDDNDRDAIARATERLLAALAAEADYAG